MSWNLLKALQRGPENKALKAVASVAIVLMISKSIQALTDEYLDPSQAVHGSIGPFNFNLLADLGTVINSLAAISNFNYFTTKPGAASNVDNVREPLFISVDANIEATSPKHSC